MKQMIARFLCVWLLVCPATGLCVGGAAQAEGYAEVSDNITMMNA